jgi:hypothetical protein
MIEITNERELREFFSQKCAVLFFDAPWSRYALISKAMMEFVEDYAKMGKRNVAFYYLGELKPERMPLAEALVTAGVGSAIAFVGNGSLSFFKNGQHMLTMSSVIGEGTGAVWRHIDDLFGEPRRELSHLRAQPRRHRV